MADELGKLPEGPAFLRNLNEVGKTNNEGKVRPGAFKCSGSDKADLEKGKGGLSWTFCTEKLSVLQELDKYRNEVSNDGSPHGICCVTVSEIAEIDSNRNVTPEGEELSPRHDPMGPEEDCNHDYCDDHWSSGCPNEDQRKQLANYANFDARLRIRYGEVV